jgi:hypothetical protein
VVNLATIGKKPSGFWIYMGQTTPDMKNTFENPEYDL